MARVTTIEEVGAVVRGDRGQLVRIVAVIEWTRLSENHARYPGDVVVRTENVGPGYREMSAWASRLTPAQPGDVGKHPHWSDCECGEPYTGPQPWCRWQPMPASWEKGEA